MGYQLKRSQAVRKGLERVQREFIDAGVAMLDAEDESTAFRVHEARKAVKKLRALLRLTPRGPSLDLEDAYYREAGRALRALREDTVVRATLDTVHTHAAATVPDAAVERVRRVLDERSVLTLSDEAVAMAIAQARYLLVTARRFATPWPQGSGFDVIEPGLHRMIETVHRRFRRYRRHDDPAIGHRLRKAVKYHRYQIQLVEASWPEMLSAYVGVLDTLGECLGEQHDLEDFLKRLATIDEPHLAEDCAGLHAAVIVRHRELRRQALQLGARVVAESETALTRRLRRYFALWRRRSAR